MVIDYSKEDGSNRVVTIPGSGRSDDVWIETYQGKRFHVLFPQVSEVDIFDIAHALSNQGRFTGHTKFFYSVAEHAINVMQLIAGKYPENYLLQLQALLHDASEAYLTDLHRPAKAFTDIGPPYLALERKVMSVICARFDIPEGMPEEIKWADNAMLRMEAEQLMHNIERWADLLPEAPRRLLIGLDPPVAEKYFLSWFEELITKCGRQIEKYR